MTFVHEIYDQIQNCADNTESALPAVFFHERELTSVRRGVAEYSDFGHIDGYVSETVQDRRYVTINH